MNELRELELLNLVYKNCSKINNGDRTEFIINDIHKLVEDINKYFIENYAK